MTARDITDDERAFFRQNGWVKLNQLIQPEMAARLLEAAQRLVADLQALADEGTDPRLSINERSRRVFKDGDLEALWYPELMTVGLGRTEPFYGAATDPTLGRVTHQLIDRARLGAAHVPTCLTSNVLLLKRPDGGYESQGTSYHQDDATHLGLDRVGLIQVWVALEDIIPDQGTMRFLSGSHREGPLGLQRPELLSDYRGLLDLYQWSDHMHYRAGDATAHHQFTIHGTGANVTDRARWAWVCSYAAGDIKVRPDGQLRPMRDEEGQLLRVYPPAHPIN